MGQIMIPTNQAEAPVGDGGSMPFPKGSWSAEIDEVRVRELPPWADTPGRGYEHADGEVLSIQFGSTSPLDGQDAIGAKKHFVDIVIRDGEETSETVDVSAKDCAHWQLQKGTRMLANLGMALGETEELETEDGPMTCVSEDFLDNLTAGKFTSCEVAFGIVHKPWTNGAKSGTEVITKEFFQAV